jgi:hypothetical protein
VPESETECLHREINEVVQRHLARTTRLICLIWLRRWEKASGSNPAWSGGAMGQSARWRPRRNLRAPQEARGARVLELGCVLARIARSQLTFEFVNWRRTTEQITLGKVHP